MFINNLKASIRSMGKSKLYTLANILGLGSALAACLLIFLFAVDQLRYDTEFSNGDNIYRVHDEQLFSGQFVKAATIPNNWGPMLLEGTSSVKQVVRVRKIDLFTPFFEVGDNKFYEDGVLWMDSTAFDLFDVEFLHGDPKNALVTSDAVVITDQLANKYFGKTNALGEVLRMDGDRLLQVTGIIVKPKRSHINFDVLLSFPTTGRPFWVNTYIMLNEGVDKDRAQQEISSFIKERFQAVDGQSFRFETDLFPLKDIYLKSDVESGVGKNGNLLYVRVLVAVAILILIIASLNYINLSTAKYGNRIKEIGVRKALGSTRNQLVNLVLNESILTVSMASALAFLVAYAALPSYNQLLSENLSLLDFGLNDWIIIAVVLVVIGLVSGIYPALVISGYNPVMALKGAKGQSSGSFRKGLTIVQFVISFSVLFIGLVMKGQLEYLNTADLGFQKEGVLVINTRDNSVRGKLNIIKNEFLEYPGIENVSFCQGLPGRRVTSFQYTMPENEEGQKKKLMTAFAGDNDFLKTLDLQLLDGRDFRKGNPLDTFSFILNESAVKALNWEEPLEKKIGVSYFNKMGKVIGVVKNFHFESLHKDVGPAVIQLMPGRFLSSMVVRIQEEKREEILKWMEGQWSQYGAKSPFSYYDLDQNVNELYKTEKQVSETLSALSVIAVLLVSAGLLSLVSFVTKKRTREMGIRKVIGASNAEVVKILARDFLILLTVALIISIPLSFFFGDAWLGQFAFRGEFNIMPYIQMTLLIILVTALTVGFHVTKASKMKPVEVLKEE